MKKVFQYIILVFIMFIIHYPMWPSVIATINKWWGLLPLISWTITGGILSTVINDWIEKILYKDLK